MFSLYAYRGLLAVMAVVSADMSTNISLKTEDVINVTVVEQSTSVGNYLRGGFVDKNGDGFVAVYEENGAANSTEGSLETHCFTVLVAGKDTVEEHGYCTDETPQGDVVMWQLTSKPRAMDDLALEGTKRALWGIGKYKGIVGSAAFTCQIVGNTSVYKTTCENR